MAFRRFTRSRSGFGRSNFSRSRRRPSLRRPGDRRWEKTQFLLGSSPEGNTPAGSLTEQFQMFHIASIASSLSQTTTATPAGIALGAMQRNLLIGGIEFDWGIEFLGPRIQEGVDPADLVQHHQVGLCSDEIVFDGVSADVPRALFANWTPFANAFPVAALTTTTPSLDSFEPTRPLHIHWKNTHVHNYGSLLLAVSEDLQVPLQQPVLTRRGHVSKRLKLVLNDSQGLYFYWALINTDGFAADADARGAFVWFCGTLFWRYQQ